MLFLRSLLPHVPKPVKLVKRVLFFGLPPPCSFQVELVTFRLFRDAAASPFPPGPPFMVDNGLGLLFFSSVASSPPPSLSFLLSLGAYASVSSSLWRRSFFAFFAPDFG